MAFFWLILYIHMLETFHTPDCVNQQASLSTRHPRLFCRTQARSLNNWGYLERGRARKKLNLAYS